MLALNVYIAMCYHKLDYYDVSQEVLASYVQQFPDSVGGINLKACNYYKLYNGKAAEVRGGREGGRDGGKERGEDQGVESALRVPLRLS